jgi:hypothetical protein
MLTPLPSNDDDGIISVLVQATIKTIRVKSPVSLLLHAKREGGRDSLPTSLYSHPQLTYHVVCSLHVLLSNEDDVDSVRYSLDNNDVSETFVLLFS